MNEAAPQARREPAARELFARMGYEHVATHRTKAIEVWQQGDITYILNDEPGSHARAFVDGGAARLRDRAARARVGRGLIAHRRKAALLGLLACRPLAPEQTLALVLVIVGPALRAGDQEGQGLAACSLIATPHDVTLRLGRPRHVR